MSAWVMAKTVPVLSGSRPGGPDRRALQQLLEPLLGPEEDAAEMNAFETEIGTDALPLLLGDVEAEQDLPVAVGGQLGDQAPHGFGLLVEEDRRERARRGMDRLGQLLVVSLGPAA